MQADYPEQQHVEKAVDNLVDKRVDIPVDKAEDKSVNNFAEAEQPWYVMLSARLTDWHHDAKEADKNHIKQIIVNLGQALDAGHTCIQWDSLQLDKLYHPLLVDEFKAAQNPAPLVRAGDYLYFYRQWQQEHGLAERLLNLLGPIRPVTVQFAADEQANPLQRQAIQLAAQQPFSLITGGPGTGKTYTLVRIVKALQQAQPDLRVALAAPTGKAAQRMQSVLDNAFAEQGIDAGNIQTAQTVHRLLGLGNGSKPRYDRNNPLPYDLIVLDEGSMLDLALGSLLFDAVAAGTRFIILGDADQLAAVDAGAVLADLQQSAALASYQVHLIESKRFAADQGIGQLAQAVLQQQVAQAMALLAQADNAQISYYPLQDEAIKKDKTLQQQLFNQLWQGFDAYVTALQQGVDIQQLFSVFDQYRILAAMRLGVMGTARINQEMSLRLKQQLTTHAVADGTRSGVGEWFNGRPVMMSRNDYGLQLSNGDIGICLQDAQGKWQVHFPHLTKPIAVSRLPVHDISTAFALTIHKSQGSEFKHVAICMDASAQELLSRELLYTAITRAKAQVSVWASAATMQTAIRQKMLRQTGLKRMLNRQFIGNKEKGDSVHIM